MLTRYTPEELKHLRDSPLVVKPSGLPPAEEWMGPPTDTARNSTKPTTDRTKSHDSHTLLDQTNRRPGPERHISRNSANPEDIILGPPKTSFMSATSIRNSNKTFDSPDRPALREADSRDRFNFRAKAGEGENERTRESRNNLRPKRADGEDSDGWSTVKPRKSFGTEGAERFNGRMGVGHREERRFKDREDRDVKDRPRGFDTFSRDKEGDHEQERERETRRNGTGRGRNEPSWFKDRENSDPPPAARDRNSNGDRFVDRSRGWREKDRDDRGDRGERADRGGDRDRGDRRWDRDREQRQERDPEWMDEPAEEKNKAHTQEDFQKWKEHMAGKDKPATAPVEDVAKPDAGASFFGLERAKVETPLEVETGPDKFFYKFATPKDENPPDIGIEAKKEGIPKAKTIGKASRFTSFFSPQEDPQRRQTEPAPAMPPPLPQNGFEAMFSNNNSQSAEKEAFQQLLQKLQRQTVGGSGSTPPANAAMQPRPPPEAPQGNPMPAPEPFQQYQRQEDTRISTRNSQQAIQDMLAQRQVAGSQPTVRPEHMLQELVGQRQNAMSQSSVRPEQPPSRNTNTEFLMNLMQSAKAAPEPQRTEQVLLRMPPKGMDRQMQQQIMEREREQEMMAQRERSASQRARVPPPGFYDDPAFQQRGPPQHERANNPPHPTQILQRPPPPGLEVGWDRQPQHPQNRMVQNIAPPPGLAGGPNRMTMPQQMFPPGFPMGGFPPPDVMAGPRNMQMQPPPGFFTQPGYMPPGMNGFPGPEGMGFGAPFDGRGPPPQGFRRP